MSDNPLNPEQETVVDVEAENSVQTEVDTEVVVEAETVVTTEEPATENSTEPETQPEADPNTPNLDADPEMVEAEPDDADTAGVRLAGLSRKECEAAIKEALGGAKIPYNSVVYAKGVATIECLGEKPAEPLVAALGLDLLSEPIHTSVLPGSAGRTVFKFTG